VVEQQCLDRALQQVHQVVAAAHVRQFVREQRFHQLDRQAAEQRGRHQHHRPPPAGGDRRVDAVADAQRHRAAQSDAHREFVEASLASSCSAGAPRHAGDRPSGIRAAGAAPAAGAPADQAATIAGQLRTCS
jgi:hypothetical protein